MGGVCLLHHHRCPMPLNATQKDTDSFYLSFSTESDSSHPIQNYQEIKCLRASSLFLNNVRNGGRRSCEDS